MVMQMRERGILMTAQNVRWILAGTKTQTRRTFNDKAKWHFIEGQGDLGICPYGVPGDRLWVRETWAQPFAKMSPQATGAAAGVIYRADGPEHCSLSERAHGWGADAKWRPSIHMPRWASRIVLEITDVRVERLQEISQSDAMAEGAPLGHRTIDVISRECGYADFSRSWYAQLWDSINGAGSWDANPWVWAISFRRINDA